MSRARLVPELSCSSLQKSLEFYVDLIGFSVLYDRPEDGFAYLDFEGAELMLDQTTEAMDEERTWWTGPPEKPYGRGINLQIECSDIDGVLSRLKGAGWPLFRPIEDQWYRVHGLETGNRQFLVQDPDGYLLRLFSDLGERPVS